MRFNRKGIGILVFTAVMSLLMICCLASSKNVFAQTNVDFENGKVSECEYEITEVGKKQRKLIQSHIKKVSVIKYDDTHTYLVVENTFDSINLFSREKDSKTKVVKSEYKLRYEEGAYVANPDWLQKVISADVKIAKKKKYKDYTFGIKIKKVKSTYTMISDSARNPLNIPEFTKAIPEEISVKSGKFYIPKMQAKIDNEECEVRTLIQADGEMFQDVTGSEVYEAKKNFKLKYIARSAKYKKTDGTPSEISVETTVTVSDNGLVSSNAEAIQSYKYTQGKEIELIKNKFKTYEKAQYVAYKVETHDSEGKKSNLSANEASIEVSKNMNIKKVKAYILRNGKLEKVKKMQIKGNRLSVFGVSQAETIYLVQKGMPRWGAPIISVAVMIVIATSIVVSAVVRNKKKEMQDLELEEEEK